MANHCAVSQWKRPNPYSRLVAPTSTSFSHEILISKFKQSLLLTPLHQLAAVQDQLAALALVLAMPPTPPPPPPPTWRPAVLVAM